MTIPGPPSDAYNHKDGIYIIASNMMAVDAAKNSKAKILSIILQVILAGKILVI